MQDEIIKESVNDLGLNGLRGFGSGIGNGIDVMAWDDVKTPVKGWEWLNDDGDPDNFIAPSETASFA